MFRRRHRPWFDRLRALVWPRGGWRRASAYFGHRVRRMPGSPHSIAAGLACGVAVSFTPLVGFHFVLAALMSWAIGGSILAAAVGTVIGNPWTFPFIWFVSYRAGSWVVGEAAPVAPPGEFTMAFIIENPEAILLPMMIGGLPMAIGAWLLSFWLVRRAVARYQRMRRMRIRRRRQRAAPPTQASQPGMVDG